MPFLPNYLLAIPRLIILFIHMLSMREVLKFQDSVYFVTFVQ